MTDCWLSQYRHLTQVADWFAACGFVVAAAEYELKAEACLMQYAHDRLTQTTKEQHP